MNIDLYEPFFASLPNHGNSAWQTNLHKALADLFADPPHGNFSQWRNAVSNIPKSSTSYYKFNQSIIEIGQKQELNKHQLSELDSCLRLLIPWRKGPFSLFGTQIDAEWRSDQKWDRLHPYLPNFKNKRILDVGCGNGYYMLRLLGANAAQVIGVDPNLLFLAQFCSMTQCLREPVNTYLLPLAFEHLPAELNNFDYVFSMGVLYHRRNPLEHLRLLFRHVVPGGFVILETLIVDESYSKELKPTERYAGMRNVWSIPCPKLVNTWLQQCGFSNCELLSKHNTNFKEQRSTNWMPSYSLINFLDPENFSKTIEGYPAPKRAIFSAQRPAD